MLMVEVPERTSPCLSTEQDERGEARQRCCRTIYAARRPIALGRRAQLASARPAPSPGALLTRLKAGKISQTPPQVFEFVSSVQKPTPAENSGLKQWLSRCDSLILNHIKSNAVSP